MPSSACVKAIKVIPAAVFCSDDDHLICIYCTIQEHGQHG
ncbi:MAG: hypothetical protein IIY55_05380 [Blautia sp.]|nr:hypothetical protein [Blautia sp.]